MHETLFAVPLTFAVLHFFMFLFYREQKGNLYYALFAASLSLLIFGLFQAETTPDPDMHWYYGQLSKAASILTLLFSIRFLHHELLGYSPRFFRWLAVICVLALVFIWIIPLEFVFVFFGLVLFPEVVRVTYVGVRKRVMGARIVALGWLLFTAGCCLQLLRELGIIQFEGLFVPYLYGTIALVVAISVHLARSFALVEAENARISVIREYGDTSPVYCSPGQLNQVFMHLIRNAIEAMDEAGEIILRLGTGTEVTITLPRRQSDAER
jgi:hypothetical protein